MRGIKIGSLFGIPVKLNWTFLIILPAFAGLIAWDIAQLTEILNQLLGVDIDVDPLTTGYWPWILGFASALGLFFGVLLHEFGHSLTAMRYGYEIDSITLWLLGGVANFADFPERWRHEFVIAIAGPIVSVLVGIISYVFFVLTPAEIDSIRFVFAYLAVLNVILAGFNMLPAFPMDGGRILRAVLARNRSHAEATEQAASIGKMFAVFLGIFGLFVNWFLILIALFIYIAAAGESRHVTIRAAFEGVTVGDIMTPKEELITVREDTSITELVGRMFEERHIGYPVVRDGALVGIVTLDDATSVEEVKRDAVWVEDVMTSDLKTIDPNEEAIEAFTMMQQGDVGRIPVVDGNDELVGIISRTDVMRALDIIQNSGQAFGRPQPDRKFTK